MDCESNYQNDDQLNCSLVQDIALTEESLNLLRDKLLQAANKRINNIAENQPEQRRQTVDCIQNDQTCTMDLELGQIELTNELANKNLQNNVSDFDEFTELELDGFLDNILKSTEKKSDQTESIQIQQETATHSHVVQSSGCLQMKPKIDNKKQAKNGADVVKRQSFELTIPLNKNQQNKNKTNKKPILFNNSLIPPLQTSQKLKPAPSIANNSGQTDMNKSDGEFNKIIAQTVPKFQGKKNAPPPIIEILSDDQKEPNLNTSEKSQTSAVNSQQMKKQELKKNSNSIQGKRLLFQNKSKNTNQINYLSNPKNHQKTQFGAYITLPLRQEKKESSNKKPVFDDKLILEIKDKIIKNNPHPSPPIPPMKSSTEFIEKLKERLKTTGKAEEKPTQASNIKTNKNLEAIIQKPVNNEQASKKDDTFRKYLREFMSQDIKQKQPGLRQVNFQIVIQQGHFSIDSTKKNSTSTSGSQLVGPKNTLQITQKILTQNAHSKQMAKTTKQSPENLKSSLAKVYNLVKNSSYSEFIARRTLDQTGVIDLGVLSLQEVVEQCHSNKIITDQIYTQFLAYHSEDKILQFLEYFTDNKLQNWNYNQLKITIMDHRRLSQLLVKIYPHKYKICTPLALNHNIKLFLKNLYSLQGHLYKHMLHIMDSSSKLHLWTRLSLKYKHLEPIPVVIQESTYLQKQNRQISIPNQRGKRNGIFQNEQLKRQFKKFCN